MHFLKIFPFIDWFLKYFLHYGNSLKIESKNQFALTIRDTIRSKQADKLLRVQFSADYFQNDTSRMQIVFSLGEFYGTRYTVSELKKTGEWEKHQFSFWVNPSQFKNGDRWSIYIWNPDKNELFIDCFCCWYTHS